MASRLILTGRSDTIRTCDILLPKQVRYQAAPRSVVKGPDSKAKRLRMQGENARREYVTGTCPYSDMPDARQTGGRHCGSARKNP